MKREKIRNMMRKEKLKKEFVNDFTVKLKIRQNRAKKRLSYTWRHVFALCFDPVLLF
jgi:hypothetical protein